MVFKSTLRLTKVKCMLERNINNYKCTYLFYYIYLHINLCLYLCFLLNSENAMYFSFAVKKLYAYIYIYIYIYIYASHVNVTSANSNVYVIVCHAIPLQYSIIFFMIL